MLVRFKRTGAVPCVVVFSKCAASLPPEKLMHPAPVASNNVGNARYESPEAECRPL
jgi:hypothetical protein